MAVYESGSDAGTMVLAKQLGLMSFLPYYFFSFGTIGWAMGTIAHVLIVPRTAGGFVAKIILAAFIVGPFLAVFPVMVQGVYGSKFEEVENPPKSLSEAELEKEADKYFASCFGDSHLSEFLGQLRGERNAGGYLTTLSREAELKAANIFFTRLEKELNIPFAKLIALTDHLAIKD